MLHAWDSKNKGGGSVDKRLGMQPQRLESLEAIESQMQKHASTIPVCLLPQKFTSPLAWQMLRWRRNLASDEVRRLGQGPEVVFWPPNLSSSLTHVHTILLWYQKYNLNNQCPVKNNGQEMRFSLGEPRVPWSSNSWHINYTRLSFLSVLEVNTGSSKDVRM